MTLAAGRRLGGYEIVAPLGAGAMGEVYRATDSRLGREVAIKVLPEQFAADAERLKRFEREAKTLASLNHPNVAQIFGVDQIGDTCFLVLELVEGESLEERLKRGPLPLDEALDVGRQIAEGLEAAHDAGVIHRDLKPANIRLTPEGRIKVLDFGLAKSARPGSEAPTSTDSVLSTEQGRLLGTPTYMAPEQARGKAIDRRVDLWAFGCVLYECLTGKRAFAGETLTDVLGSVLHTTPDLSALPTATPRAVRDLIARCFEKDPRQRVRDIGEARLILERAAAQGPEEAAAATAPPASRSRVALVALLWAASLGVAVYATSLALGPRAPAAAAVVRTHIELPPDLKLDLGSGCLALSPEGGLLVMSASRGDERSQLWIRPLDSLVPQPLSGTEGASYPFWSPDGRSIAFFADGKLKRIPAVGGSVTTVCSVGDARGGTWTSRDEIVFAPAPFGGLFRVPAAGGVPEQITKVEGQISNRWPRALPGGQSLLFTELHSGRDGIRRLALDTGAITWVSDDVSDAQFVAPGSLLFVRNDSLMEQAFDPVSGTLSGQPRLVAERVDFYLARATGRYSASSNGTLIYQSPGRTQLEWFDLDGRSLGRIGAPGTYESVIVSSDGRRIVAGVSRSDGGKEEWLIDGQTGLGAALPALEDAVNVAWSPDGRSLAYAKMDEHYSMFRCALDGSGQPQRIGEGIPRDWSPDGRWISAFRQLPATGVDTVVVSADGSVEPQPLAATTANEMAGFFSPDCRWLLFRSDQSGSNQVYLAPVGRAGAARPITNSRENMAAWLDDGRILIQAPTGELYEMSTTPRGDELDLGEPRPTFGGRKAPSAATGGMVITRDGTRLLAVVPENGVGESPLVVVQNWQAREGH